jgi:hypothetical protein
MSRARQAARVVAQTSLGDTSDSTVPYVHTGSSVHSPSDLRGSLSPPSRTSSPTSYRRPSPYPSPQSHPSSEDPGGHLILRGGSPDRFSASRLPPISALTTNFVNAPSGSPSDHEQPNASTSSGQLPLPPIHVPPSPVEPYSSQTFQSVLPLAQAPKRRPVCANCGTTETPLWRRGASEEDKDKLFCNACGLYEKTVTTLFSLCTCTED